MSTCLDIVRRALRLCAGETGVPAGQEGEDGLQRLQGLILDLPGLFHNGVWRDRQVNAAYTAKESDRIAVTAPGVVTLPTLIDVYGCKRAPLDLAKVQIQGAATNKGLWLYSASLGVWSQADALEMAGPMPFGPEDDEGIAAQLAVAMVDEFGGEVSAATVAKSNQSKASFRSRFKKAAPIDCKPWDYV